MKTAHLFKSASGSLLSHKSRSFLTVLGIVVGIVAIMLVVSVGKGAEKLVLKQVEGLGAGTIAVGPGKEPKGPTDPAILETLYGDSLKIRELKALESKSNVPDVEEVMPIVFGVDTVIYEGDTFQPMILGGTELLSDIFNINTEEGDFFTENDVRSRAQVVVIGEKVKNELFGSSDAVGEKIRIGGVNLKVVGTLPKVGQVLFFNFDESVIMPYTVAQKYIFGINYFNRIILRVDEENIKHAVKDVKLTLRDLHNITDPENDDFFVGTQDEINATVSTITGALAAFLISVAAISLLVGGVGIMNIMLVSVTERRKEIGLRKALGATRGNILWQFLFESITLTVSGGVIGIAMGALLSFVIYLVLAKVMNIDWVFAFPLSAAIIGVVVSVITGLLFGLYPAYRASKKSPIEALRYE